MTLHRKFPECLYIPFSPFSPFLRDSRLYAIYYIYMYRVHINQLIQVPGDLLPQGSLGTFNITTWKYQMDHKSISSCFSSKTQE